MKLFTMLTATALPHVSLLVIDLFADTYIVSENFCLENF